MPFLIAQGASTKSFQTFTGSSFSGGKGRPADCFLMFLRDCPLRRQSLAPLCQVIKEMAAGVRDAKLANLMFSEGVPSRLRQIRIAISPLCRNLLCLNRWCQSRSFQSVQSMFCNRLKRFETV